MAKKRRVNLVTIIHEGLQTEAKECTKCSVIKPLSDYNYKSNGLGGRSSQCKSCLKKYRDSRKELKREYDRKYREDNADNIRDYFQKWWEVNREEQNRMRNDRYYKNRDEELLNMRLYREENRDRILEYNRNYYLSNKEKFREYYELNADYIKERNREYYKANRDDFAKRWKSYYEENKEELREKGRERYQDDPEYFRSQWREYYYSPKGQAASKRESHRRRDREKGSLITLTSEEWAKTLDYFGHECAYCGSKEDITQDHLIPVSKGGDYTSYNIIPACGSCNYSKRDEDFSVWYRKQTSFCDLREYYIKGFARYMKNRFIPNVV